MAYEERVRLSPEARREIIGRAAAVVANNLDRVSAVTHEATAEECEVKTSVATVARYYPTRKDLMNAALASGHLGEHVDTDIPEIA